MMDDQTELEAENTRLREALHRLWREAPISYCCSAFDHSKKTDRHIFYDPCPPLKRYKDALEAAGAALQQPTSTESK